MEKATNFDCSAYFVRDSGTLIRTFEIHPEYLKTGKIFISHTSLRGKYVLRLAIGARMTGERNVREAWELMMATAGDLSA